MAELFKCNESDREYVKKFYDATDESLKRDIEILKEWLKKQPHLPQGIQDDCFFENVLIRNKNRVEKAKQKIDDYYSIRGARKDFLEGVENIVPSKIAMGLISSPNLTENRERIIIIYFTNPDPNFFVYEECCKTALAMMDLLWKYDYSTGVRIIYNFKGLSLSHIKKINPTMGGKMTQLLQDGYSKKIFGLEFINISPIVTGLVNILKIILPKKMFEKIRFHENLESLHKIVSKEYLPKDLGGNLPTSLDLLQKMDGIYKDHHDFFIENRKYVSNEKLRIGPSKYKEDLFGTEGTFKKINLD